MEWALPALCFVLPFTLLALAAALYALHLSIQTQIEQRALKNSTHSIQFVPADEAAAQGDDELDKALEREDSRAFQEMDDIHHRSEPLM
jgi:hypothetical protein